MERLVHKTFLQGDYLILRKVNFHLTFAEFGWYQWKNIK